MPEEIMTSVAKEDVYAKGREAYCDGYSSVGWMSYQVYMSAALREKGLNGWYAASQDPECVKIRNQRMG